MKDETAYLHHIQECIRRIEENVAEGRDRFMTSHTLQDAVLRNLQTIADSRPFSVAELPAFAAATAE